MSINDRIKEWRIKGKLTQREAGSKLGVPYSSYQKYEMGPSVPGADALECFAKAGVNTNWLLTGDGPMLVSGDKPLQSLDLERIRLAIEATEEGLRSANRDMEPVKKAELILAVYDLLEEPSVSKERVLKLVKFAA